MENGGGIDRAVHHVADGLAVDWQAFALSATKPDERAALECLQIIDALARAHRVEDSHRLTPPELLETGPNLPAGADAAASGAQLWGRFRLLQEVGAGGNGSVYRAWDPDLEREVAIKILHRHVGNADLRRKVLQEGRALAKVRDANVVSVLGVEAFGAEVGLCMEFIQGETLEGLLRTHGMLNAREAALWGQDICRALAAVHLAGFVHRDVKPQNVMRDRTGRIVLMDFGTGLNLDELTAEAGVRIVGTPLYMAPEVLAGQPAGLASDVYGVGVLLYHLATAAYPVEGRTVDEIKAAHMQGRRTPLAERRGDLPLVFRQIVDRALAARPEERWPSAAAMLDALAHFVANADEHVVARKATVLGVSALSLGAVLIGLGALSSKYFNSFVLGRDNFVHESVWEWMYWGAHSLISPSVLFMIALLGCSLLLVIRRILVGLSASARRLEEAVVRRARGLCDDVWMASAWALVTACVVLAAAWWTNLPMLSMIVGLFPHNISNAPVDKLLFLGPDQLYAHEDYRVWFIWSTILSGAVWVPVIRFAARRRQPINPLMRLGGAIVFALSLALLDLPYRAFSKNALETATWEGKHCYVLGERDQDLLMFCPELVTPRNRLVPKNTAGLRRLGVKEKVFDRIGSTP